MQRIDLKPGMRVRCVDVAGASLSLELGKEYRITRVGKRYCHIDHEDAVTRGGWLQCRFKPIVRVKAPCVPSLSLALKRVVAWFDALTPEQQDAHREEQRKSWARGEAGLENGRHERLIFANAH